jgi:dethiobiotin synthetase
MLTRLPQLNRPGLFVTATDTGVGKTVVTCAIAAALRRQGLRVGASKPMSSGCRHEREGLVNEDAEALAYFSDASQSLDIINPLRYRAPLSPAVAQERGEEGGELIAITRSLELLDRTSDILLVEGVGGLLAPLLADDPQATVLDLIVDVGYPVVVVTRPLLGTLSHTAMTVRLLREAGCSVAGLVINSYEPDPTAFVRATPEESSQVALWMDTNPGWLSKMNRLPVLATVPRCACGEVQPHLGRLPAAVLEPVAMVDWTTLARPQRRPR